MVIQSNNTMKKYLFIYAVVATILCGVMYGFYSKSKATTKRLSNNQIALTDSLERYKTENGKNAVKIDQLTLTTSEFKKICGEQKELLDDMNIKVKYLENMSTTGTKTVVNASTILRDSIIYTYRDSIIEHKTVQAFEWADTWNRIKGYVNGDKVECSYQGVDTLTIVATRVPKKFLFFKWGTKKIEMNIMNSNPYSTITYNKSVTIKK